jgi:hypothetical protein
MELEPVTAPDDADRALARRVALAFEAPIASEHATEQWPIDRQAIANLYRQQKDLGLGFMTAALQARETWLAELLAQHVSEVAADRDAAIVANADLGARLALAFAAMTEAAGELRHAYRNPDVIDRNLVARAIVLLERGVQPDANPPGSSYLAIGPCTRCGDRVGSSRNILGQRCWLCLPCVDEVTRCAP